MKTGNLFLLVFVILASCLACCTGSGGSGSSGRQPVSPPSQVPTPAPLPPTPSLGTPPATSVPAPLPIRGDQPADRVTIRFNSSGKVRQVSFDLDTAALPTTGGGNDCPLSSWHPDDTQELAAYYAGIFRDPAEDALYTPLISELRRIRRTENLNDDEYLELMVNLVQAIPYDPSAPVCPRTPAGVILDGKGDCDEKSLLLLGMLYREGYDAAILLFPAMHHATAGIRIQLETQPSFRVFDLGGRKYVYIETTHPSFIGLYPDGFEDQDPVIVPTGKGNITYRAINDVMHIVSTQKRMEEKLRWINETGTGMLAEIQDLEQKLRSGTGYSSQEDFDADYTKYVSLVTQYNAYVDEFGKILDVYQYVLDHETDRHGVSGRIANSKVENLL